MNNFEKIKKMDIEKMSDFFSSLKPKGCGLCMGSYTGCLREVSCKGAIKDWLLSEYPPKYLDSKKLT